MNYKTIVTSIIKSANAVKAKPKTKKLSKKALDIKALIANSDFGCKRNTVSKLMSVVIGENLEESKDHPTPGTIVRVVANESSHEYDIGQLVVLGAASDGSENAMDAMDASCEEYFLHDNDYVLATSFGDIKKFIKDIKDDNFKTMAKFLI